jgi:GT2 family glycosyltransferase
MIDLSIGVINYNTIELTSRAIESCISNIKHVDYEIIVVDNASENNEAEELKRQFGDRITVIENSTNKYFTGGYNQIFDISTGRYVLMMNSDSYFVDNSALNLLNKIESNDQLAIVGGQIIDNQTGNVTMTGSAELTPLLEKIRCNKILRFLFSNKIKSYKYSDWDRTSDKEVHVICNAFSIVDKEKFWHVGGFDEALKLYFSEEYICDQFHKMGFKAMHLASAKVLHDWSSSTSKVSAKKIHSLYLADRSLYFALK